MNKQSTLILLANVIHATTATMQKVAMDSTDTAIRANGRRMGQPVAMRECVAIEMKNHLTKGTV